MTWDPAHDRTATANRRAKALSLAQECWGQGVDPITITEPKDRRDVERSALRRENPARRNTHCSDETWDLASVLWADHLSWYRRKQLGLPLPPQLPTES
jgi:hypothetical protein